MRALRYILLAAVVISFSAAVCALYIFSPAEHRALPFSPAVTAGEAPEDRGTGAPLGEGPDEPETEPPETEPAPFVPDLPPDKERVYDDFTVRGRFAPSEETASKVGDAIEAFGRPTVFYAVDIETGMTIGRGEDEVYDTASAVKILAALYAFRQIDAGKLSLDEMLTYTEGDYVYGEGIIGHMEFGTQLSLRDVLYHTLNTSDNEGYTMLVRRLDRVDMDKMLEGLGVRVPCYRWTYWPHLTCRELAAVWAEVYRYRDETDGGRMLFDLVSHTEQMHFFRDALGYDTAVKSGWNRSKFGEGGIVFGERTYILVLITDGNYWDANKEGFFNIVRSVDALFCEYAALFVPPGEAETQPETQSETQREAP